MSGDQVYCYPPDFSVLKNKFDITDQSKLDELERRFVLVRSESGIPSGNFDLAHLQAIHRHLFQDVFEWAGELRTVEISKGGHQFQFRRFIETGMAHIHRQLVANDFFRDLPPSEFAANAAETIGNVNYVHPFREGNGRTQLYYLEQLASNAGHIVDLTLLDRREWMEASRRAHINDFEPMRLCISQALTGPSLKPDNTTRRRRHR